jgi:DnaJ-class molecular chaperone
MGTWIIRLVAVGGACYLAYSYFQPRETIAPATAPATAAPPSVATQIVNCEACKGLGRIITLSRGLSPHTGSREVSYTCPVCSGVRRRAVTVPLNSELCPRCRGMGRTEITGTREDGKRIQAQSCALCRGSGVYAKTFP